MNPFTAHKRWKTWNKTRENYRGSYYNQEEWLEEFFYDKVEFFDGSESDNIEKMVRIVVKI